MLPRFLFILLLLAMGCQSRFTIVDRPISFSEARIAATKAYITAHYGLTPDTIEIVPRIIVLHWTAIDDTEATFAVFDQEMLAGSRPELAGAGDVNVSVQFMVSPEGTVYRLMPETWMGRHCIGLNYDSIGVENVGGANGVDNLTAAQISANIALVRDLVARYPTIEYLIGHAEYRQFEGHPLWRELDAGYRTEKNDPSARFLAAVRAGLEDLGLKSVEDR